MILQEVIDELQKIPNKNIPVVILHEKMNCGSSQTGVWGSEECVELHRIKLVEADELAGLTGIDKVQHIELISDDLLDLY